MTTPVVDFLRRYAASGTSRLHMPGHKGQPLLGCEALDITEIRGADALYEADGILAESEHNAALLFGTGRTLYSAEGSSQCIRAMLYLAVNHRREGTAPVVLAARNVHKAYLYAAALIGFQTEWLWPEQPDSLCACRISPEGLEAALAAMAEKPAAVYLTSPDYLGNLQDISALAEVCHRHGTLLLADNAHGAYLKFLTPSLHPMDLGADLCCDSAHKTLPALTGAAYLHISRGAPACFAENAKAAMALFGSTSPSYLIMGSLDAVNGALANGFDEEIRLCARRTEALKQKLTARGWRVSGDPLRITLDAASAGYTGTELAEQLRAHRVECEYADPEDLVLMTAPGLTETDWSRLENALCGLPLKSGGRPVLPLLRCETVISAREAFFAPHETIPAELTAGRICAAPTVGCPPAIPIVAAGERIPEEAEVLFRHYGIDRVDVLKSSKE